MKQDITYIIPDYEEKITKIKGGKIVIFGAGLFLTPVIHSLKQLDVHICCICDNSKEKQNTIIDSLEVLSPQEALSKYPEAYYVISTYPKYIEEIKTQLIKLGIEKIIDAIYFLANFRYDKNSFKKGLSVLHFEMDEYVKQYFGTFKKNIFVIPSLDIVITEKCSLKCKDCANLMQYYANPKNINYEKLFSYMDLLMESVNYVLEFRVIGGETFMNPQAYKFINRLREYKNYNHIAVYSNGTIVPKGKNLKALKFPDTYLRISNYGEISDKINEMKILFNKNDIQYDVENCDLWQDCSSIEKHNYSEEQLERIYSECCVKDFMTILGPNLYICPFAANANNLGAIPKHKGEYVCLDGSQTKTQIRNTLSSMLQEKKYFSTCKFCNGRSLKEMNIPSAIQISKPLKLKKFAEK